MKVLLQYRVIPAGVLQESLAGLRPLPTAYVIHPSKLKSLGEFWQAMKGKPRPAINYTVIVDVDIYESQNLPLISSKSIDVANKE
jgi:hypothetical protein